MNISTSGTPFQQTVSGAFQDGQLSRSELRQIKDAVNQSQATDSEKQAFMELANTISRATTNGVFRSEEITPAEMKKIAEQAEGMKDSPLVKDMMKSFDENAKVKNPIANFLRQLFDGLEKALSGANAGRHASAQTSAADFQNFRSAVSDANSVNFPQNQNSGTQYQNNVNDGFGGAYTDGVSGASGSAGTSGVGAQASVDGDNAFVPQFSEGTSKEMQANCGPACAAMMMSALGVNPPPDMSDIRASVGARTGNGSGPFAISTDQLIRAVEKTTGRSGVTSNLPVSAQTAGEQIAERLEAGKNVIILTGGMGGSSGHYMMVKGVDFNPDGSIKSLTVDDPGSSNGENRVISGAKLQEIMGNRSAAGKTNQLLTF